MYYAGLNNSKIINDDLDDENENNFLTIIEKFTLIPFDMIDDIDIGWNYAILWRDERAYISGNMQHNMKTLKDLKIFTNNSPLELPQNVNKG